MGRLGVRARVQRVVLVRGRAVFIAVSVPLLAAGMASGLAVPGAAASPRAAVAATTTPAIRHAVRLSPLGASHPLSLEVALAIRNEAALQARVQSLNDPASPMYHQFLTPQQTTALYGPTKAQLTTVEQFLKANGITTGYVSPQRNFLDARATVRTAERAFGVRIWQWRDALTRRVFYANASDPVLPAAVARLVTSITGLDDYAQPPGPLPAPRPAVRASRSHRSAGPGGIPATATCTTSPPGGAPSGQCAEPAAAGNQGYSPAQLQQAYTVTQLAGSNLCGPNKCNGTGQNVGIIADGTTWGPAAEAAFEQQYGLTSPATKAKCDPKLPCPLSYNPSGGGTEADLDVDMVHAIAPGAQVTFFEVKTSSPFNFEADLMRGLALDLNADTTPVTSISLGECETDFGQSVILTTLHHQFALLAAQGQAVFAASGDHGSNCSTSATFFDGSATSGSPTFTSATANFTAADQGNPITEVDSQGAIPNSTTIQSVDSPTTVTLSQNATATATGIAFQLPARPSLQPGVLTPASDPQVTAVGGTNLFLNTDNSYAFEYAKSESGGGQSAYWPRPSWQQGAEMPSLATYPNRLVPDVSAEGTCPICVHAIAGHDYDITGMYPGAHIGCPIYTGSSPAPGVTGGTSCAAPIWAAIATLYNQYAQYATLTRAQQLGANANQLLYNLAVKDHRYAGAITNVTYNPPYTFDLFDPAGPCPSGPCWNGATGLGSPEVYPMVLDLPLMKITPGAGQPGTAVAVSGTGFLPGEAVTARDASDTNAVLCHAAATSNGSFHCSATVPTTAPYGEQQVVATGKTSQEKGLALFDLVANTHTAYVANSSDGTVMPIDTATNAAGAPISVGAEPIGIAITPNGATAYVVNEGDGTVTPIDTATNTPGPPITVGGGPYGIAITPNGATAYVANLFSRTVTPIATATNTPGKPITVGNQPDSIAITPNGATAYVVNGDGTVTPIATATNTPGKPIKVGAGPFGIAITPNGATAYVTSGGSSGIVTPISTATNTPGKPIKVGTQPNGIAITPNGATAYVVNNGDGTITPIATATNTPGTPIKVGAGPFGIAITPNGATAYVVNNGDGTITPIATATNTPGTPITVGTGPTGIATSYDWSP